MLPWQGDEAHETREASGPARQLIIILLMLGLGALFWFAQPEAAAKRCARTAEEMTQHRILKAADSADPGESIPVTKQADPADVAWYAEHCQEGKPR